MIGIARSGTWRRAAPGVALVALVGCGGVPPTSPIASGNKPAVVVQAPAAGTQVAFGAEVLVSGAATDSVGVEQVVLFVDGVSVATTPDQQPLPLMPFTLSWPATLAGAHTLQVFAYRTDGTPSDPAVVPITVGAPASGIPTGGGPPGSLGPSTVPTVPAAFTPEPTRKPRRTPALSSGPSVAPTIPPTLPPVTSAPPTPPPPTATPVPMPTIPADGRAADDTLLEPHLITLTDCSLQVCPAGVLAMGSITEQISAPEGDTKDQLYFVPVASGDYKIELTSCTDVSDGTVWKPTLSTDTLITGCTDWLVLQFSSSPPAQSLIDVTYAAVSGQMYNSYVYTIYLLDQ